MPEFHKNRIEIVPLALVVALLCGLLVVPCAAADSALRTVRVGWVLTGEESSGSESTGQHAYMREYLQALSQYTGWEFEYVDGTWDECLERLEYGEIDASVGSDEDRTDTERVITHLASNSWYFITDIDYQEMLTQLDATMVQLYAYCPTSTATYIKSTSASTRTASRFSRPWNARFKTAKKSEKSRRENRGGFFNSIRRTYPLHSKSGSRRRPARRSAPRLRRGICR